MMSYSQLKKELPFPLKMVTVEMTRKTLEEAILWSRTNVEDGHETEEGEEVAVRRSEERGTRNDERCRGKTCHIIALRSRQS